MNAWASAYHFRFDIQPESLFAKEDSSSKIISIAKRDGIA